MALKLNDCSCGDKAQLVQSAWQKTKGLHTCKVRCADEHGECKSTVWKNTPEEAAQAWNDGEVN